MKIDEIRLLIIEDNPADLRLDREILAASDDPVFKISSAGLLTDGLKLLEREKPDAILLDVNLPDSKGLDGLKEVVRQSPEVPIVVLTGADDSNLGIEAIHNRAMDYLVKGRIDTDLLVRSIKYSIERKRGEKALRQAHNELEKRVEERTGELKKALAEISKLKEKLENENVYLQEESRQRHRWGNIIGESDGLKYVLFRVEQVAPVDTNVLILGETGTGKELVAAAIHELSPRKNRPLITVNCAALPASLVESELFGREKGAFTGADSRQVGRFEIADGSTLCLDEIGEMPLELQAKLLRAVQHGSFERLGSSKTVKVDVRLIATTNRNLEEEVKKGKFRQDLFYRLNVFPITLPPLRQRKEDIPLLVGEFMERYSMKMRRHISKISKETMNMLKDYSWPGNIRELESVIERAVIVSPGPALQLADKLDVSAVPDDHSNAKTLEETEKNQILKILSETAWRIEGAGGAAEILGLNASTLRARMKKLGIARPKIQ